MESLLGHVGSLSTSLADRDAVIGSLIDNLTTVMGTVAARDEQLSSLVVSLQQFVTGLADDRVAIFDSLQTIDTLAVDDDRLPRGRPAPAGRRHPASSATSPATWPTPGTSWRTSCSSPRPRST